MAVHVNVRRASASRTDAAGPGPNVLSISLDSQIATPAVRGTGTFGDPVERQRRYAARLAALHVVVKTTPTVQRARVALAPNAWAYPTSSRSRLAFVPDAYRIGAGIGRAHPIDVISAQDPFGTGLVAYLLAGRFGKPFNLQLHFDVLDNPYWLRERREHRPLNALGKWLLRKADTVRVGTARERAKLMAWGIEPARVHLAPVPVDLERFGAAATDEQTRALLGDGDAIVLAACRIVPQKDLGTFLRAAAAVLARRPGTRFAIAGDGSELPALRQLAESLGIDRQVRFLPRIPHDDMPAYLATADVLAVTSTYEGTSLVTLEAAAAGTPTVSTDVAGAADTIVDGKTGRIVPVRDAVAFAEALLDLLADPDRRREMGRAARAHVATLFGLESSVDAVISMWTATAVCAGRGQDCAGEGQDGRRPQSSPAKSWLYLANARIPSEKAHVYQIVQMVDALRRSGVEVELAFPRRDNLDELGARDPVAFYGLRSRPRLRPLFSIDPVRLVTIDVPALNRPPLPAAAFAVQTASFAAAAAAHVRGTAAAAVYGRDWPVLAAGLLGRRTLPTFWEAHDLPQGRLARAALRRLVRHLAGVIAISHGLADELAGLGVPHGRLLVAPDAVDLDRFADAPSQAEARHRLGLPRTVRIVGYTGQLYAWKGVHTLARAARLLPPDVQVHVVGGTAADLRAFRAFLEAERLERVQLAGYVPPAQIPLWLAAADVVALPNSGRERISSRYTSPLKLFEYMAAGRPIVASDLPSLREVLRHGENAILVPPDDPEQLAAGLTTLLDEPALAGQLAAAAQRQVQEHSWEARARRVVAFVEARTSAARAAT